MTAWDDRPSWWLDRNDRYDGPLTLPKPRENVPTGGRVVGVKELGLPVPEISKFHVAGFRVSAEQAHNHPDIRVRFQIIVRNVETGEWTTVDRVSYFPSKRREESAATWSDDWKRFVYASLKSLLMHELDECLLFEGKNLHEPHPELRAKAKPEPATVQALQEAGLFEDTGDKPPPPSKLARLSLEEIQAAVSRLR